MKTIAIDARGASKEELLEYGFIYGDRIAEFSDQGIEDGAQIIISKNGDVWEYFYIAKDRHFMNVYKPVKWGSASSIKNAVDEVLTMRSRGQMIDGSRYDLNAVEILHNDLEAFRITAQRAAYSLLYTISLLESKPRMNIIKSLVRELSASFFLFDTINIFRECRIISERCRMLQRANVPTSKAPDRYSSIDPTEKLPQVVSV